jgi:hypothetical protein
LTLMTSLNCGVDVLCLRAVEPDLTGERSIRVMMKLCGHSGCHLAGFFGQARPKSEICLLVPGLASKRGMAVRERTAAKGYGRSRTS